MNKKKICKIAGAVVATTAMVAVGAFYGIQQLGNSSDGSMTSSQSVAVQKLSATKEEHEVTLHFKWEGSQPHVAYSVEGTDIATTTPGVPMKDEGNGWYTYTIKNVEEADVTISVPELDYTTTEFSRSEGEYWYNLDTGWYTKAPDNYEEPVVEKAEPTDVPEKEITEDAVSVAESSKVIIHYPSDWDSVYMYAWNALPDDIEMDWPGEELEEEDGYYSYTFASTTKVNFLFTGGGKQTDDYTIKTAGEYWYKDGKWVTGKPSDNPEETVDPTETDKPEESINPNATLKPASTPVMSTDDSDDFREETIYFLITTRFYDGDSSNNEHCSDEKADQKNSSDPSWRGDFAGLEEKLDYIKALGFSAIWITPIVQNKSGMDYHGYHAWNFNKVDDRYAANGMSAEGSYQSLINAAHSKGIKIIQDVVFNHSSNYGVEDLYTVPGSDWAERKGNAMKGVGDTDNIYHHTNACGSGDYDNYNAQTFHIANDCLDLETENPIVYEYLVKAYKKYINMGVDAFRIDTAKHISRLTMNSVFLPAFHEEAASVGTKGFYMFGEVCTKGHDVWYRDNPPVSTCFYTWAETGTWANAWTTDLATNERLVEEHYNSNLDKNSQPTSKNAFLEGNNYHTPDYSQNSGMGVIDFQMHWSFDNATNAYNTSKGGDRYFNDATWNVVYVDSHDYAPDVQQTQRYNGGEAAWAENMSLMWTYRGIPCIYYGSEIRFQEGKVIDPGYCDSTTGRAYFGDNLEGSVTATDYGEYTASGTVADTLNSALAQQLIRLNKIRRAVPALQKGQYSTENVSGNMAYKRRYTANGEDSFVCVTISDSATFSGIPGGTYVDLVTGDSQTVSEGGTLSANCSGRGNARVYVLQNATAEKYGANGKVGKDTAYLK